MTIAALIHDMGKRGIALRSDGDWIQVDYPEGALTESDVEVLRARKREVIIQIGDACGCAMNRTHWRDQPDPRDRRWVVTECGRCGRRLGCRTADGQPRVRY
ncbi:MAG: hypothetical protein AB8B91_25755 [Rubripirellula sp.]